MSARSVPSAVLIFTALALALGLVGCNEAKGADLVGTWNLTTASRRYLPPDMVSLSPRLVLRADGRFAATDLPGAFHGTVGVVDQNSGVGNGEIRNKGRTATDTAELRR
jgi:hypothetical protein